MHAPHFDCAEADLKIAFAKRKLKAAQLAHVQQLVRNNAVSADVVLNAETEVEIAEAELDKAKILVQLAAEDVKPSGK